MRLAHSIRMHGVTLALAGVLLAACAPATTPPGGPTDPNLEPGEPVTYELKRPVLNSIAPTEVALGDEVKVFGKDFIDERHGNLLLHYVGSFKKLDGSEARAEGDFRLIYVSPGQARFEFGPSIPFTPSGMDLGTFSGMFQVRSQLTAPAINAEPGDEEISEAQNLAMKAGPSIYVDQLRSVDDNCDPVTTATVGETNLAVGVRALGVGQATAQAPITFSFSFKSPTLTAKYVRNEWYQQWPLVPTAYMDTMDGSSNTFSIPVTSGTSVVIDPQHYEQVVTANPPVTIGQMQYNQVKLARLSTGKVDKPGANILSLLVQAKKPDGTTLTRTINFPVWNQVELQSWGNVEKIKEVFPPEAASLGCTSGGLLGADVQYSEGTSESKSRTINMNWNIQNALSLGLSVGYSFGSSVNIGLPDLGVGINNQVHVDANTQATWSQTFGVDVSQTVSTEEHKNSTLSIRIPPNFYAMSYRQATRLERRAPVVYHNACGVQGSVGEAVLNNWTWGFDVAQGAECPPVTRLPPAQKF